MSDFGQFNQEFQKQAYIKEPTLAQAENPLMSLMREYVRAKEAYDKGFMIPRAQRPQ